MPVGYGDGWFRNLSSKCQCLIRGKRFNIVGSICMDVSMVDVGTNENNEIKAGDEVIFIGKQGDDFISADDIANVLGTIPYEITSAIAARVPRVYV